MANPVFLNGPAGSGYVGKVCQGGFDPNIFEGRATFPTTGTACTLPNRGSGQTTVRLVLLQYAVAAANVMSYAIQTDGTVIVTRTDTTSNGEFSFLIKYA